MGIITALVIITLWSAHLFYALFLFDFEYSSIFTYVHILVQTYLFTGLFITAHDAIHGTISGSARLNRMFGRICSSLFACLSWSRLLKNHFNHHKYPGTEKDPDFSASQNFFKWWFSFLAKYSTPVQFICMALIYNVLKFFVPEINLIFLWILPAFLSTFQLFYFGTFKPHKVPHTHEMMPHNARSQKKNFLWGLLSCYFFGFHYEHHSSPGTPWWGLYNLKK